MDGWLVHSVSSRNTCCASYGCARSSQDFGMLGASRVACKRVRAGME